MSRISSFSVAFTRVFVFGGVSSSEASSLSRFIGLMAFVRESVKKKLDFDDSSFSPSPLPSSLSPSSTWVDGGGVDVGGNYSEMVVPKDIELQKHGGADFQFQFPNVRVDAAVGSPSLDIPFSFSCLLLVSSHDFLAVASFISHSIFFLLLCLDGCILPDYYSNIRSPPSSKHFTVACHQHCWNRHASPFHQISALLFFIPKSFILVCCSGEDSP